MRLRMNRSYLGDRLLGVRVSDLASSLCFAACYLSMIFQLLGGSWQPALRVSAIVFAVILLAYMVGKGLVGTKVIIAGLALVSFTLVDAFVIGSKDLPALMQMYIMFVLGLYLVRCNVLVVVARVIFWIVLASMAYLYSISPNHYEIFPTQGRNFCGAYALLAFMVLAIAATRKDGRVTNELMASAIACLALSVYTVGRGSILACALLVALVFVVRLKNNKGVTSRALSVSMVVIVAVASFFLAMLVDGDLANQLFGRFGSVSAGRSDEARSMLYGDYLSAVLSNRDALLFGMDPRRIVNATIIATGGNLHCSYLQWHANFGLAGLLVLVGTVALGLRRLWIDGNQVVCVAAAAVFVRAMTDTMLVGGIWDIAFFFLLFTVFLHGGSKLRSSQ